MKIRNLAIFGGLGIGFVLLYDIWTNFGWWYLMYPHTTQTFATVYLAGIPFMIYHLISGITTFIFIGAPILTLASQKIPQTSIQSIKLIQKLPVILITIAVIGLAFSGTAAQIPQKSDIWLEKAEETSIKIILIGDTWTLEDNLFAMEDETVFTLLERTLNRHDMSFEYTYYPDFDANLIDTIHTTHNGDDGKYWQYWVDNELPMVGADQFSLENGVVVEWRFEAIPN